LEILKERNKRRMWKRIQPSPFKIDSLWKLLFKLSGPQDLEITINNYWKEEWKQTENERYSKFSA